MKRVDRLYFEWLISQIEIQTQDRRHSYNDLFRRMFETEFLWLIPHDDSRIQDALDLRNEFKHTGVKIRDDEFNIFCRGATVLEVVVSLSRRVAFTATGAQEWWAWQLISNLRLRKMTDPFNDYKLKRTDDILYALIWRTYKPNGEGGFFPLEDPKEDQRQVDIWYQMQAYVNEIDQG